MPRPVQCLPLPSLAQLAGQETEPNLFVHFCLNTFTGRKWGDDTESPACLNPTRLGCDQQTCIARSGGFKIDPLTVKHHHGFCLSLATQVRNWLGDTGLKPCLARWFKNFAKGCKV